MKKLKLLIPCLLVFSINVLFLTSCDKDIAFDNNNTKATDFKQSDVQADLASDIRVENGILVFRTEEDFHNSLAALQLMDALEISNWENSLGFKSMRSIFGDIVLAEWENEENERSSNYELALEKGIITENNQSYELNIFNPAYSLVINELAMVKIGANLYQMTPNSLKIWESGDINKLKTLSDTQTETADIQILGFESNSSKLLYKTLSWADKCENHLKNSRLELICRFDSYYPNSLDKRSIFINYYVIARCLTNTKNGWKIDPKAYVEIQGDSEVEFTISDGLSASTTIEKASNYISSRNGNLTFMPEVAGKHKLTDRKIFSKPCKLNFAKWEALAITRSRDVHNCSIEKPIR